MKTARALAISAVAASLILSGCSTETGGRAQQDNTTTTTTSAVCPSGTVLSKIGKCVDAAPTTTSPSAAPNANPTATLPSVSACDGTQCDLTTSDDEVDRLVAKSLTDVNRMWKSLNVDVSLHLYKDGAADCPSPRRDDATAWTCVLTHSGGWNPAEMRAWATDHGTSLEDTVRATIAHEIGHVVLDGWGTAGDDLVTKETRADCLAGGYAKWTTLDPNNSAMGQLTLDTMKRVFKGPHRNAAVEAGFTGTPKTCASWTP